MGCESSKPEPSKTAPSPEKKAGADKAKIWANGEDFPSELRDVTIKNPDRPLSGLKLVNCTIENAKDNNIVDSTLTHCTLTNCTLINCSIQQGSTATKCVVKGGTVTDATLVSGTEVSVGTKIERSMINDRCTVSNCEIGNVLTTTGSLFINCKGNPQPPPSADNCTNCTWGSGEGV